LAIPSLGRTDGGDIDGIGSIHVARDMSAGKRAGQKHFEQRALIPLDNLTEASDNCTDGVPALFVFEIANGVNDANHDGCIWEL
jgi:hypothetical protein